MALCFPVFQQWWLLPVLEGHSVPGTSTSKRRKKQKLLVQRSLNIFHLLSFNYKVNDQIWVVIWSGSRISCMGIAPREPVNEAGYRTRLNQVITASKTKLCKMSRTWYYEKHEQPASLWYKILSSFSWIWSVSVCQCHLRYLYGSVALVIPKLSTGTLHTSLQLG